MMPKEYGYSEGHEPMGEDKWEVPEVCPNCDTPLTGGPKCPNCDFEVPIEPVE